MSRRTYWLLLIGVPFLVLTWIPLRDELTLRWKHHTIMSDMVETSPTRKVLLSFEPEKRGDEPLYQILFYYQAGGQEYSLKSHRKPLPDSEHTFNAPPVIVYSATKPHIATLKPYLVQIPLWQSLTLIFVVTGVGALLCALLLHHLLRKLSSWSEGLPADDDDPPLPLGPFFGIMLTIYLAGAGILRLLQRFLSLPPIPDEPILYYAAYLASYIFYKNHARGFNRAERLRIMGGIVMIGALIRLLPPLLILHIHGLTLEDLPTGFILLMLCYGGLEDAAMAALLVSAGGRQAG